MMKNEIIYNQLISETMKFLRSTGIANERAVEILLLLFYAKRTFKQSAKQDEVNIDGFKEFMIDFNKNEIIDFTVNLDQLSPTEFEKLLNIWRILDSETSPDGVGSDEDAQGFFKSLMDEVASDPYYDHNTFTPKEVCDLISSSIEKDNVKSIYDPSCGTGGLLTSVASKINSAKSIIGKSRSVNSYRLGQMNALLNNNHADIGLAKPNLINSSNDKFDIVISNLPFGQLIDQGQHFRDGYFSSRFKSKKGEVLFLTHILDHLSEEGRAAVIVPTGFLFASGIMQELRKEIIQENLLEAVVQLPARLFYNTGVSTAILFFSKKKSSELILMVDISDKGFKTKERIILKPHDINDTVKEIELFREKKRKSEKKNVAYVPKVDLERNNHVLQMSLYENSTSNESQSFRPSDEILKECQQIEKRISILQKVFHV